MEPLPLTIVLYLFRSLHQYHISKLSSTLFLLLSISLFVVYTVNLPVVRPRSCRVIYYFDTPTLGRRHQSFDRVNLHPWLASNFNVYAIGPSIDHLTFNFFNFILDFNRLGPYNSVPFKDWSLAAKVFNLTPNWLQNFSFLGIFPMISIN